MSFPLPEHCPRQRVSSFKLAFAHIARGSVALCCDCGCDCDWQSRDRMDAKERQAAADKLRGMHEGGGGQ
jgi:hypothetical protein